MFCYLRRRLCRVVTAYTFDRTRLIYTIFAVIMVRVVESHLPQFCILTQNYDLGHFFDLRSRLGLGETIPAEQSGSVEYNRRHDHCG